VVDPHVLVVAGVAVFAGAFVQGVVGMGVGLVAAPVVTLLDPTLMPVSLLVVGFVLSVCVLLAERRHVDRGAGWVLLGQLAGTPPGAWVVTVISAGQLALAIGVLVLLAIGLTVRSVTVPVNRWSLCIAGVLSAVSATAAAIGGPPLGVVYQRSGGPLVRATVSLVFAIGSSMSLGALALTGQVHPHAAWTGIALVPFLLAGFALATPFRRRLAGPGFRTAVLVVVGVSGLAALVQGLVSLLA
jgi:uncharacterized membrane protein YfcA